jgi:hypothetical protein
MERYFKLTEETIVNEAGRKLRQIECIRDFKFAHAGELGGFIEKEENLGGEAWVDEGAQVWGEAKVINGSVLRGNSRVYGRSKVRNGSVIYDEARVYDYALVDACSVGGQAKVYGKSWISRGVSMADQTEVFGLANIENSCLLHNASVSGRACLNCSMVLSTDAYVTHNSDFCQFYNLCPTADRTTVYRTKAGDIRIYHADEVYTLEAFTELVDQASDELVFKQVYPAVLAVIKVRFPL